jgi:hypothetical protein
LTESGQSPDVFFHTHRGGRGADGDWGALLANHAPRPDALDHPLWAAGSAPTNHIDQVEALWAAIDRDDDWPHCKPMSRRSVNWVRRWALPRCPSVMRDRHGTFPRFLNTPATC